MTPPPPAPRRRAIAVQSGFVRLGGLVTAVFLVANLAAFAAAHILSTRQMEDRLHSGLIRDLADLRAVAAAGGQAALEAETRAHAGADGPFYALWPGPQGGAIVGNARIDAPFRGFRDLDEDALQPTAPMARADAYVALGAEIDGRPVVIARSAEARDEIAEIFSRTLLSGLALSAILAVAGTLWFLGRAEARIADIGSTLDAVAGGDLGRRVPGGATQGDLARVSAAINVMLDRLESNVAGLRQVSADIAHDLRTPLTRLRGALERLGPAPAPGAIDDAIGQLDAIVASFNALLRIAQVEGGSPRARFAPLDLSALCADFTELYQAEAEAQGRVFAVDLPEGPPIMVAGDRDLLGQMLSNLLENALRHAPAPAAIALQLRRGDGAAQITVADRGPGIPPQERARVFQRHYRLERSRTADGAGLGLSLAAAVAQLHGGDIVLEDNAPGLRASVRIPLGAPGA